MCFFTDIVIPAGGSSSNNYYWGAGGLHVDGWPYMNSSGGELWYIYWENVINQPIAYYGSGLYGKATCVKTQF